MSPRVDRMLLSAEYEIAFESIKWLEKMPAMEFPKGWKVRIIPPFCGAIIRFHAVKNDRTVSVYLDCYDALGMVGSPYWEAYPIGEDTARWAMDDWQSMIKGVDEELSRE